MLRENVDVVELDIVHYRMSCEMCLLGALQSAMAEGTIEQNYSADALLSVLNHFSSLLNDLGGLIYVENQNERISST